jgi:hypothetical protein
MPVDLHNLSNITLTIDGVLLTSPYWQEWPTDGSGRQSVYPFIQISDSEDITINGQGTVEGQGYDWWVREWNHKNKFGRPNLLQYNRVQTSEISGVAWRNGPRFHLLL